MMHEEKRREREDSKLERSREPAFKAAAKNRYREPTTTTKNNVPLVVVIVVVHVVLSHHHHLCFEFRRFRQSRGVLKALVRRDFRKTII